MESTDGVSVQIVRKPERKAIIKRGIRAENYFAYCQEVGCELWEQLRGMAAPDSEPVCLWLPEAYREPNSSAYVQGVEVEASHSDAVPEGFDVIALQATDYLLFQGQPFRDEDYAGAITALRQAMERLDPGELGYAWDDAQPRIQLEPLGERGYIELRAVKSKA